MKILMDGEFLRTYTIDEGPPYPCGSGDVGERVRALQLKELRASCKNIFAPVNLKYDAAHENRKRFNREYSVARLVRPGGYTNHLTD